MKFHLHIRNVVQSEEKEFCAGEVNPLLFKSTRGGDRYGLPYNVQPEYTDYNKNVSWTTSMERYGEFNIGAVLVQIQDNLPCDEAAI